MLLQKKALQKKALDFCLENQSCDRRQNYFLPPQLTPVAEPIFETKNRAIFLERFFGRGITDREQLSRAKNSLDFKKSGNLLICIESYWLPTREGNYCRNVFSSWKRRNTTRFRTLLFGKEAVKTFFYKCSNSGKMNPLHSQLMGTKL